MIRLSSPETRERVDLYPSIQGDICTLSRSSFLHKHTLSCRFALYCFQLFFHSWITESVLSGQHIHCTHTHTHTHPKVCPSTHPPLISVWGHLSITALFPQLPVRFPSMHLEVLPFTRSAGDCLTLLKQNRSPEWTHTHTHKAKLFYAKLHAVEYRTNFLSVCL